MSDTSPESTDSSRSQAADEPLTLGTPASWQTDRKALTRLSPEVRHQLENFQPIKVRAETWAIIGPYVRDAVARAAPSSASSAMKYCSPVASLLSWCCGAGLDLRPDVVFHPDTIDRWVTDSSGFSASTRACYRSVVRKFAAKVVGPPLYPPSPVMNLSPPLAPYTAAELAVIVSWARGLPTERMRQRVGVIIALALGAGLHAGEIEAATAACVHPMFPTGFEIRVRGNRARRVPLVSRWDATLHDAVFRSRGGSLLFPNQAKVRERAINGLFSGLPTSPSPKLSVPRLRTTWIVQHLDAGVPLNLLAEVAGTEHFTRYMAFMASPQPSDRRLLRAVAD